MAHTNILFVNTFIELGIESQLLKAVTDLGFEIPTEIQQKSIPILLSGTTDFIGLAPVSYTHLDVYKRQRLL